MLKYARDNWLFLLPLAVFAAYYGVQGVIGAHTQWADLVAPFAILMLVSIVAYVLAYMFIPVGWFERLLPRAPGEQAIERVMLASIAVYLVVVVVAIITADRTPLFETFRGASAGDLANYRNAFLRTRTGYGSLLNYAYVILGASLVPIAVTYGYWKGAAWRHLAVAIFAFGLALTLAKSAFASAAFPLVALFLMQRKFKAAAVAVLAFLGVVGLMYVLASGEGPDPAQRPHATASVVIDSPSAVPAPYNIFETDTQAAYIVNRIIWIPYVTALDWLRYQRDVLDGSFVLGRSIKPVAFLTGQPYLHVEREVAGLQWGAVSDATSNAVYVTDAWLNFGWFGIIAYSVLLAVTIKLISTSGFMPLVAGAAVPVWTICFNALPPVYFSGGLGVFLVLALLLRKNKPTFSIEKH